MKKKILWIEDDTFILMGIMEPFIKSGFIIDAAKTGAEAYDYCLRWREYDMIIVDLILNLRSYNGKLNETIISWNKSNSYVGVELIKWLFDELEVKCPVVIMSVLDEPLLRFNLGSYKIAGTIPKKGSNPAHIPQILMGYIT